MADRNGYFQIVPKDDGTYIHFFPSQGSGEPVNVKDLDSYLSTKNIPYDKIPVYTAAQKNEDTIIKLNANKIRPVDEFMMFFVSEDRMSVTSRFYPPSDGASLMTEEEIRNDFKYNKITAEPDKEALDGFMKDRRYCTDYILVKGTPPKEGRDGYVEYKFNTDPIARPAPKEDGSVDFHALSTVRACGEGQVLAILHKEEHGEIGRDVFGEVKRPKEVKKAGLRHNKDCTLKDDGTLVSNVDGHVSLIDGVVFVSSVLELENVDVATGDINYEGNLLVNGNICTGYKVNVTGDIEVKGVIEAAEVTAGGQITVAKGINGMEKGVIKAGNSVVAKYINSATVESEGMIQAELILNSRVSAKDMIRVQGRKGFITGGYARAGSVIEARTIGSDMGGDTTIEVGVDPALKARHAKLIKENEEIRASLARTEPVLQATIDRIKRGEKLPPEHIAKMKELNNVIDQQKKTRDKNLEELAEIEVSFDSDTVAEVVVMSIAYAGTRIVVSDTSLVLKKDYQYCRFRREGADVKMVAM